MLKPICHVSIFVLTRRRTHGKTRRISAKIRPFFVRCYPNQLKLRAYRKFFTPVHSILLCHQFRVLKAAVYDSTSRKAKQQASNKLSAIGILKKLFCSLVTLWVGEWNLVNPRYSLKVRSTTSKAEHQLRGYAIERRMQLARRAKLKQTYGTSVWFL